MISFAVSQAFDVAEHEDGSDPRLFFANITSGKLSVLSEFRRHNILPVTPDLCAGFCLLTMQNPDG